MPLPRLFIFPPLAQPPEPLKRTFMLLTLVAAWAGVLVLGAAAWATGAREMAWQSLTTAVFAVLVTGQIVLGSLRPLVTVGAAFVTNAVAHRLSTAHDTMPLAASAAVLMACVGVVFVMRHVWPYLVGGTIVLLLVAQWWNQDVDSGPEWGVSMATLFLVLSVVVLFGRATIHANAENYQTLFEKAPIALVEQDWTDVMAYVASLGKPPAELVRGELEEAFARVRFVRTNRAFLDLMQPKAGVAPETVGIERARTLPGDLMAAEVAAVLANQADFQWTYLTTSYQGGPEIWLTVRSIVSRNDEHGVTLLLSFENATDRVAREMDLTDLVRQKDRFIATVSHELRTPLTAVVGLAEILADEEKEPLRREMFGLLVGQSRELSYLVEDLLVGARVETGTVAIHPEPIDLAIEVGRVVDGLNDPLIEVDIPDRLMAIADPLRTRQILRNLLVNARRYGGDRRRLIARPDPSRPTLEVRDSGAPLPPEDAERIFAPYQQAHPHRNEVGGLGLGLHVSRHLAELMDGTLTYFHDGETVFRLVLPGPGAES